VTVRIGWYVHHHGRGHLTRLLAVARHLDAEIQCFSSLARPDELPPHCAWTVLDRDDEPTPDLDPRASDPTAGGLLHWAPLGHTGHGSRLAAIAASLPVDAFVVDVSVEVALLVRLLGTRTVVFAQPGRRDDAAHRIGYRAATTIIAPWPRALLRPAHLEDMRDKTVYTGGISRFEDRADFDPPRAPHPRRDVVLLGGRGGADVTASAIADAAASSGHRWRNLGATPDATWSTDPWTDLTSARVVVSWAGQNSIADLAAADAAAVVIPQQRPFAEQLEMASALDRAGLAVVATEWPPAAEWQELIDRATNLRPDWSQWGVPGAAVRAADAIYRTAMGVR